MCQVPFSELYTCLRYSFPKSGASFYYYTILQLRELRHREIKCLAQDLIARRSWWNILGLGEGSLTPETWFFASIYPAFLWTFVTVNLWVCFSVKVAARFLELDVTFLSYAVYEERWVHPQHWETTISWETTEKWSGSISISLLLGWYKATVLGWSSNTWLFCCCSTWSSGHPFSQASCLRTDARHLVTKWGIAPSPWSRREMGEGP